jgi:Gpi18-like mannosyltransferase
MKRHTNTNLAVLAVILILAGLILRIMGLGIITEDMRVFYVKWYELLSRQGFSALQAGFSDYTPPYLYLLWITTWSRSLIPEVIAIKLLSMLFDLGNAFWIYKISSIKYPQGLIPLAGAAIFFALPTFILDSAWWGQVDSIYTFFVLTSLYFLLKNKPLRAMIFFGIAFSFKLQAIFLAPYLLLLTLKRRIPYLYSLVVPGVYIAMMIPAILMGRPILDTLTIYLTQTNVFRLLNTNAPNLYLFISNDWYDPVLKFGLGLTALLALLWVIGNLRYTKTWTPEIMIMGAAVCAMMIPFFLPKMHDRYFYVADVLFLLLAIYLPRMWYWVLTSQVVSTITYSIYIIFNKPGSASLVPEPLVILAALLTILTVLINTVMLGILFWKQYRLVVESSDQKGTV